MHQSVRSHPRLRYSTELRAVRAQLTTVQSSMFHSRCIPTCALRTRSYATVPFRPPLLGLNSVVREKAEQLSRDWKGTNASGENTKNFIGGEFVQSKATQWVDVVDPVRRAFPPSFYLT